jgi:ribosomal protein S18 acetylase RimI-like enzyme
MVFFMVEQDSDIVDYGDRGVADVVSLSRDLIPVRSMAEGDLAAIIRIDQKVTGRDRTTYYERKFKEVMSESGVRVSLVAEMDGIPAGFIMARVDFGEFGKTEPAAVIDTIAVDPGLSKTGVGRALLSQLLVNLAGLHIETVRTIVPWDNLSLLSFLKKRGFAPSQRLLLTRRVD